VMDDDLIDRYSDPELDDWRRNPAIFIQVDAFLVGFVLGGAVCALIYRGWITMKDFAEFALFISLAWLVLEIVNRRRMR